jgi:hypothetical protein
MYPIRLGKKAMNGESTLKTVAHDVAVIGLVGAAVFATGLYVVDKVTDVIPDLPGIPGFTQAAKWALDELGDRGLPVPHQYTVGADGKIDDFEPITDKTPLYNRRVVMDSIEVGDGVVIKGEYAIETSMVGDLTMGRDGDAGDPNTQFYIFVHDDNGTSGDPVDDTLTPFDPNSPRLQFVDAIGGTVRVVETAKLYEQCLVDLDAADQPGGDRSLAGCEIREVNPAVKQVPASIVESARQAFLFDQQCADDTLHMMTNTVNSGLTSPIDVNESGIMGPQTITMQHLADRALANRFAPLVQTTPDKVHLVVEPQPETITVTGESSNFSQALPLPWTAAKHLDLTAVEKNSAGLYKAPPVVVSWCSGSTRDLQVKVQNIGGPLSKPEFSTDYLANPLVYAAPKSVVPIMNPALPELSTASGSTNPRGQTATTETTNVTTTTVG